MTPRLCFLCLYLALLLYCPASMAVENALSKKQFVSIVQLYPWGYTDFTTGELKGIHVELLDALSTLTHVEYEPLIKPYARVEKDVISGNTPFTFLAADDKRLRHHAHYGMTLFILPFGIVHNMGPRVSAPRDFSNLDIAVPRGLSISNCFHSGVKARTKVTGCSEGIDAYYHIPVVDYTNGLKLLSGKKVDGLLGSLPTLRTILATQTDSMSIMDLSQKASYVVIQEVPVKVVYSNSSPFSGAVEDIEAAFQVLIDEGIHERIYQKHIAEPFSPVKTN